MADVVEVFPVEPLTVPAYGIRRGSRAGKPCRREGTWYTDTHNARRGLKRHAAQDIFAAPGSPVVAPQAGVIVDSSADRGPTPKGGHFVRLASGRRAYWMSHLLETPAVRVGDEVEAGAMLGLLGDTGNAETTCPHLHIGARRAWQRSDGRWVFGAALNIYRELRAVDPTTAPETRRLPELPRPTAETPCRTCGRKVVVLR